MIEFLNIDCMEYMQTLPSRAFALAIVDPPYGIPKSWGGAGKLKSRVMNRDTKKLKRWDVQPSQDYFDELFRVSKNQIIWGGNYFPLPPTRGIIAWDKMQPWENFSAWEMAWTSFDCPARIFRRRFNSETKIHPTQKPVVLYSWLLTHYANKGDRILDTHLGSGSIALACHDLGFDFVGCEIDEEYFTAAKAWLEKFQSQLLMDFKN